MKPVKDEDRKSYYVKTRVTRLECKALRDKAASSGVNVSDFMRNRVLDGRPAPQLTTAQKRVLVEDELRRDPVRPNRLIARLVGVSHSTVREIRRRLEAVGQIVQLKTTVGHDGKTYRVRRSVSCATETDEVACVVATLEKEK